MKSLDFGKRQCLAFSVICALGLNANKSRRWSFAEE